MKMVKNDGANGADHVFALPAGHLINEYEIRAVLGHGSCAITYFALDKQTNELVTIAEYLPSYLAVRLPNMTVGPKSEADREWFQEGLEAFLEEARAIEPLRHRNIAKVQRIFELNGTGYVVRSYEDGTPLSTMIAEGPLANSKLRTILLGILSGLEAIHGRGLLHRSIKPANVIVRSDGSPVLIGLGAAHVYKRHLSQQATALMSRGYTAPELYLTGEQQGPWTDFYSLGATAYHCVTGEMPQYASYRRDLTRLAGKDPMISAETAGAGRYYAELLNAIDWMLRPDKAERPKTVAEIRALIDPPAPQLDESQGLTPTKPPGRPAWRLAACIAAALLIVAGAGIFGHLWFGLQSEEAQFKAAQNDIDRLDSYLQTCRQCEFKPAAEQRLAQLYAQALVSAGYDRTRLEANLTICGLSCPGDLRQEVRTRLDTLDAEKAQYHDAQDDIVRLETYSRSCRGCEFKGEVERHLAQLYSEALRSAGYDRAKLEENLALCDRGCPGELRQETRRRLDTLDAEKAQYRAAQNDITRLEAYVHDCRACEFKGEAEQRLAQLYADELKGAGYDRAKLERNLTLCDRTCPSDVRQETHARLDILDAEKSQYRAAQDDTAQLETYVHDCRACEFKSEAERRLAQLYAEALKSAGFDRTKLEKLLTICGRSCPGELRQEARRRLGALDAEKPLYPAGQDDFARLESYVRDCRACEFKSDAERRLTQLYAEAIRSAGFDRAKLEKALTICGRTCSGDLRQEARARLNSLDAEKTQYHAAQDDVTRLEAYVHDCRACEFKGDAEQHLAQLYAEALRSAGFDRAKLERNLTLCGASCPNDLRQETRARLNTLDAEKAQYNAAGDDIVRLETYVHNCRVCEYKGDAERLLPQLRSMLPEVPPTPVAQSAERTSLIPDPAQQGSSPDLEYLKALRRDTVEGYEAFLRGFPDYPKNQAIRTLLEARQQEALWKQAEKAPSNEARRQLCDSLLLTYPQGAYAERARQCLTAPVVDSQPQAAGSCYYVARLDPNGRSWLALRTAPSFEGLRSRTHMPSGTRLILLERHGEWMHVRLQSGEIGWANSRYLTGCRSRSIPETRN